MNIVKITSVALTLSTLCACSLLMPSPDKMAAIIIDECDTSRDNLISREEAAICKEDDTVSELHDMFDQHDQDKDELISQAELNAAVREYQR